LSALQLVYNPHRTYRALSIGSAMMSLAVMHRSAGARPCPSNSSGSPCTRESVPPSIWTAVVAPRVAKLPYRTSTLNPVGVVALSVDKTSLRLHFSDIYGRAFLFTAAFLSLTTRAFTFIATPVSPLPTLLFNLTSPHATDIRTCWNRRNGAQPLGWLLHEELITILRRGGRLSWILRCSYCRALQSGCVRSCFYYY
jgi:hypothetical protein